MRIFLSYCHRNTEEADLIYAELTSTHKLSITRDIIDLAPYDSLSRFMESVREHDFVIKLISADYLQSKACMKELVHFMKDDTQRTHYADRTLPIIVNAHNGDRVDFFTDDGQLEIIKFWLDKKKTLEDKITQLVSDHTDAGRAVQAQRQELFVLRDIAENIGDYLSLLANHLNVALFDDLRSQQFAPLVERIKGRSESPADHTSIVHLRALDQAIVVHSVDDPENPEFPPFSPKFPATPTTTISVEGRRIHVKDESYNPTGSHKDRMAWEIVVHYKKLIRDRFSSSIAPALPAASIISSGCAAFAIQSMLRLFGLPDLRVLLDINCVDERVDDRLASIGCHIYRHDLGAEVLTSENILQLTKNTGGFDITARALLDPSKRFYYDWMTYEILNQACSHIFVPVGTGDLLTNILTILRDEVTGIVNDRRLRVGASDIANINVYGATSNDPKTSMDKLYAKYRPTLGEAQELLDKLKAAKICGPKSGIFEVDERHARDAVRVARFNNIATEPSGIAGLALFLSKRDEIPLKSRVLVVNTGWMFLPARAN